MRLSTAEQEFIAYKRNQGLSPNTLRAYHAALKLFIDHVSHETGREGTVHFTRAMVESFFAHKDTQTRDITRKTLACYQTALREFAKWGQRKRYWSEDPLADAERFRHGKSLPRPYSRDEFNALMALTLEPQETVLRTLLYYAGLREFEACGLRLRDLFRPADSRGIARLRILGKGRKERVISVGPQAWAIISPWLAQRYAIEQQTDAVLLSRKDGSAWSPKMIWERVRQWGERAGVPACTPHRFRHTCATHMLEAGEDIRVIQRFLGHASLATTEIYTRVSDARLDAAALRLEL